MYKPEQLKKITRVPSGECPIKFKHFWDIGCLPPAPIICAWFWEVRDYGLRRGEFFTAEAIAYWAQYEFNSDTDEYNEIVSIIKEYAKLINDPYAPENKDEV